MNGKILLNLGGSIRPLKFNMYAVKKFDDIKASGDAGEILKLVYGGLHGGCLIENKDADFTTEDVSDWIDELIMNDPDAVNKIMDCFSESNIYKATVKEPEQPAKKKKLTGTK